jgi:DNA-binding winged helix-turn-helix (wHTH) protein
MRIRFGAFVLDRGTRQLRRGSVLVSLPPHTFELLDLLVARRPDAVSKQEIRDQVWPDTFVAESTLSSLAAQLRNALGRSFGSWVRTVHGFGYAFDGEAVEEERHARVVAYLSWNRVPIHLIEGENVIGRASDASVRIEAPGISRHHARIVAEGGHFTVEDLGSKNGTFLGSKRLSPSGELSDGDELHLGQTRLVFRIQGLNDPTATEG